MYEQIAVRFVEVCIRRQTSFKFVAFAAAPFRCNVAWGEESYEQGTVYTASVHGGNKRMLDFSASDYQISLLEVALSSAKIEVLANTETPWKQELFSWRFGLNAN